MFGEHFPTFPSMFEGPFTGANNGNMRDNNSSQHFPHNNSQESMKPNKAGQNGERIIPIKVINSNSDSFNLNQVD